MIHSQVQQFAWLHVSVLLRALRCYELCQRHATERRKERQPAEDVPTRELPPARVTQIVIREGDSFEVALKRFSRNVQQAGILSEWKRRQRYEPPSVKRKRKAEARDRKQRRAQAKAAARGY